MSIHASSQRVATRLRSRVAAAILGAFSLLPLPLSGDDFSFVLKESWSNGTQPVTLLASSPDSSWLATGGKASVRIYSIEADRTPGLVAELARFPDSLRSLAISPGGETLAAVDGGGTLHLFDLESRQLLQSLPRKATADAVTVAFTADGSYVLTGGKKGAIRIFTMDGGSFAHLEDGHQKRRLVLVAGVPPGREMVSIGEDRRILLWDADIQRLVRSIEVDMDIRAAAFGGGKILALGLQKITGNRSRNSDGKPLYVKALDIVRLVDVETGSVLRDLAGGDQDIHAVGVTPDDRFVAAGGSAGHAMVWRVEDGRLLTRIPSDSELSALAFAPDGSWMATGTEKGQVSIFALTGVDPRASIDSLQPESPKILIIILEPESLALSRDVSTPVRLNSRSVRIHGRVHTPTNLTSLEVGGREITAITPTDSGYLFTADVSLPRPGLYEIDVLVKDAAGHSGHETVKIERPAEAPDTSAQLAPPEGRRLALIVGVSSYRTPSIDLRYASRDARAVHDLLSSPALGPAALDPRDLRLLLDRDATVERINTGLREFLQQATEKDFVLFYFAGHGIPDPNRPQDLYLMAHDSDPENIAGSGLLMRHVREAIAEVRARDVLILTDACHSAGMAAPRNIRSLAINPIHNVFLEKMRHASGGLAILTASEAAQVSLEGPKWQGHGVFTYFLLEGLRGAADLDQDRLVTLGEIMEFVREQVKDATGAQQIPAIGPTSFDREMPLVLVPEPTQPATGSREDDSHSEGAAVLEPASSPPPTPRGNTPGEQPVTSKQIVQKETLMQFAPTSIPRTLLTLLIAGSLLCFIIPRSASQESGVRDLTEGEPTVEDLIEALKLPGDDLDTGILARGLSEATPKPVCKTTFFETGQRGLSSSRVALSVLFALDSDEITPSAVSTLNTLGQALVSRDLASLCIGIEGHTDDIGDEAYNFELSRRRAESVKRFLAETFAIDTNRLMVSGHGESRPLAPNNDEKGRQRNRRVQIQAFGVGG